MRAYMRPVVGIFSLAMMKVACISNPNLKNGLYFFGPRTTSGFWK
jgi:hypothetical protein